jgi:protoporphyrinogen oxidase
MSKTQTLIIGAGPAGLTAAYELAKRQRHSIIVEKDSMVGGIARTVESSGNYFDIGGHRFFTKIPRVMAMWQEVLGQDFLKRPRLSRIYYRKKFFYYPIKIFDVMKKLGLWESALCGASFFISRFKKRPHEENFEDYIVNRFGWRLYSLFFKSYTEKVWGIPCTKIKAEWAAQRIKGLSFVTLLKTALLGNRGNAIKTLIEEFYYPRLGPGMMWRRTAEAVEKSGYGRVIYDSQPVEIVHDGRRVTGCRLRGDGNSQSELWEVDNIISSMPLQELIGLFSPRLSEGVIKAAHSLNYRDFITVALVVNRREIFPDNWIYIHEPGVRLGRIQNFKNWSPDMVADKNQSCLGLEYFCFKNDAMWNMSDQDLVNLAKDELEKIGLVKKNEISAGTVVRMEKTYPIYDDNYEQAMPIIKKALSAFSNFYTVGRNGMHHYNNQDHSMYTAMLAVENIFGAKNDLWQVNTERVYHEEVK